MRGLFVIGLSHRTAPVEVREGLVQGRDESKLVETLREAAALCDEAMLVSTCNRVELYGSLARADEPDSAARLTDLSTLLVREQLDAKKHLYTWTGSEALRHLFRVTSSLDSMIIGEPQILGQMKASFARAQQARTIGAVLSCAVPRALSAAKRVRSETFIGQCATSVAAVAAALARQVFGELKGQSVLLIGAGKMAELCARHLREAGATDFLIANRTPERATALASRLDGSAHPLEALPALLKQAAIVLCSTGAAQPLIRPELMSGVMKERRGRWLLLIDIAVPRDIDPGVAKLDNVYLYDIDALSAVVTSNLDERRSAASAAEAIVEAELKRAMQHERSAEVVPLIRSLRERAQDVARAEVAKVLPRLNGIGERERQLISALAESVVNKLLHSPLTVLKQDAAEHEGAELAEAARRLWALLTPTPRSSNRDELNHE